MSPWAIYHCAISNMLPTSYGLSWSGLDVFNWD